MKQISAELAAHIAGEVTTLATCWKLTCRDSAILGFTDHDRDIHFDSITYRAATGFTPSAIANSTSLSVYNLDVEGMLTDGSITESEIMAGRYDFAAIEIFEVNYNDLTQGALKLRRGWLGEISMHKQQFIAEVRGLTQSLSQTIGELYSPSCRASFGDNRCKVNAGDYTVTGSVTTLLSSQEFHDSARSETTGSFGFGIINFTSGANTGLSMEVKEYILMAAGGGQIVLALPMPHPVLIGDNYTLIQGCNKTAQACHERYNNIVNFRGEPHVPGLDRMLETAGTRSQW